MSLGNLLACLKTNYGSHRERVRGRVAVAKAVLAALPRCSAEALESRVLLSATLVADISTATAGSNPLIIADLGGTAYFFADDGVHGMELWRSDGTAAGTTLVKDINPGPASSILSGSALLKIDGALFFAADDGVHGYELWKTDGTDAGTVLVNDIAAGSASSSPQSLINVNGSIFFFSGKTLWRSNGTAGGATPVKDIPFGSSAAAPPMAVVGDTLFIGTGTALWKSDGTAPGTVQLTSNLFGTLYLTALGNLLLFMGNGELWKSDGTPKGTTLLKDLNAAGTSLAKYFTNVNGTVFFAADDGIHGDELWKTDGTAEGTVLVADLVPGATGSSPICLTDVNGTLFFSTSWFSATVQAGRYGFWKSDGTVEGTALVKQGVGAAFFTEFNGRIVFSGGDAADGARLWTTDGTDAGTTPIGAPFSIFPVWMPGPLVNVGGRLFFGAIDDGHGLELWTADGTPAGTGMLKDINATPAKPRTQQSLTHLNGTLFFSGSDPDHGNELWKSNGTLAGTTMLKDIVPGLGNSYPRYFVNIGNTVFFSPIDSYTPTSIYPYSLRLWKTDGTPEGTTLVSPVPVFVRYKINVNGTLFFEGGDDSHGGELWKSDGTAEGTVLVKDIYPGPDSSGIAELTNVNGTLFFSAYDGRSQHEQLWKTDGTGAGTILVKQLNIPDVIAVPTRLTNVNGTLYFVADDQLWKSDGTDKGTRLVKAIPGIGSGSELGPMASLNDVIYVATNGALWKSDGTSAGTVNVKLPYPQNQSYTVNASSLININGTLFFQTYGWGGYIDLWKTDGTAAGTVMVKRIAPGKEPLSNMTNVDGQLFFTASDPTYGRELWRSDGTPEGTGIVMDLNPGAGSSSPMALTNANGTLYFLADEKGWGSRLWKLPPFASLASGTLSLSGGLSDDTFTVSSNQTTTLAAWGNSALPFDSAANALALDGGGGSDTLSITDGSFAINGDLASGAPDLAMKITGAASVAFNAPQRLKSLSLTDTAVARLGGSGKSIVLQSIALGVGSQLDLAAGELVVQAAQSHPDAIIVQISNWIKSARQAGDWSGPGITSSSAASDPRRLTGLAVAINDPGDGRLINPTLDPSAILLKYTWNGDANLDGVVNADDYFLADSGYITQKGGWGNGDFNYDGVVDADDYLLIDAAFIGQSGPLAASKPELAVSADVAVQQKAKKAEPEGILSQLFSTEPVL